MHKSELIAFALFENLFSGSFAGSSASRLFPVLIRLIYTVGNNWSVKHTLANRRCSC